MQTIAIFTRTPAPGAGKSRLRACLDDATVDALVDAMVRDTLNWVQTLGTAVVICHEGDDAPFREMAPGATLRRQPVGDFGERLSATFDAAFATGASSVVLIGMDSPTLDPAVVSDCFMHLRSADDAVLVPATDGGWVALGVCRAPGDALANVPWSEVTTADETTRALRAAKYVVTVLEPGIDVDDAASLDALRATDADARRHAPLTMNLLAAITR